MLCIGSLVERPTGVHAYAEPGTVPLGVFAKRREAVDAIIGARAAS